MKYFCTLFDSNYLTRGLLMIESLLQHNPDALVYVFAFDSKSYDILKNLNIKNVVIISLKEFEDSELLKIKSLRSQVEYCWTSTPSTILYCLNNFKLDHCTYLDADLYFYNSLKEIELEVQNKSILITEHRYSPQYDQTETSGKYCVQFMYFKNDLHGRQALTWWRDRCLEWCYARVEDGKFGDQKYLDDWTSRFTKVHELQHLGAALAPWNIQQYSISKDSQNITYNNGSRVDPIFYHFHAVKLTQDHHFDLGNYRLTKAQLRYFYFPYLHKIQKTEAILQKQFPTYKTWTIATPSLKFLLKRFLKGRLYYFSAKSILKHGENYKTSHL